MCDKRRPPHQWNRFVHVKLINNCQSLEIFVEMFFWCLFSKFQQYLGTLKQIWLWGIKDRSNVFSEQVARLDTKVVMSWAGFLECSPRCSFECQLTKSFCVYCHNNIEREFFIYPTYLNIFIWKVERQKRQEDTEKISIHRLIPQKPVIAVARSDQHHELVFSPGVSHHGRDPITWAIDCVWPAFMCSRHWNWKQSCDSNWGIQYAMHVIQNAS